MGKKIKGMVSIHFLHFWIKYVRRGNIMEGGSLKTTGNAKNDVFYFLNRWVEDVAKRPNRNAILSGKSAGRISTSRSRILAAGLLEWRVNRSLSKPVRTDVHMMEFRVQASWKLTCSWGSTKFLNGTNMLRLNS